jgi:HlyD family secretion protein
MKMKAKLTRKKIVIGVIGLVVILIIAITVFKPFGGPPGTQVGALDYTVLAKSTLTDSISVTGTIESANAENVYTTVNYPVKSIQAELGNVVKAGDVLASLDTDSLVKDIEQARYSANAAAATATIQLENARSAYESAKLSFDLGEISQSDLIRAQNDVKSAEANAANKSAQSTLSKLQSQLQDSIIKAPINGTVTMVNATVGTPASGILFVIEDTNDLKVVTGIKEFDVATVKVGQLVTIKTEGTGDKVLNGIVLSIAPAALKSATGQTVASSDVEFETVVSMVDKDPALKIGMNARMSIVLAEKQNVYAVPYDAVVAKTDGTDVVFVADKQGSNYTAREVPVKTGIETDFYVEISGTDLKDGLFIISGAEKLKTGDPVVLRDVPAKK